MIEMSHVVVFKFIQLEAFASEAFQVWLRVFVCDCDESSHSDVAWHFAQGARMNYMLLIV